MTQKQNQMPSKAREEDAVTSEQSKSLTTRLDEYLPRSWQFLIAFVIVVLTGAILALVFRSFYIIPDTSSDGLVGWLGAIFAILIAMFGVFITGIFVYMTIRIEEHAKNTASHKAREIEEVIQKAKKDAREGANEIMKYKKELEEKDRKDQLNRKKIDDMEKQLKKDRNEAQSKEVQGKSSDEETRQAEPEKFDYWLVSGAAKLQQSNFKEACVFFEKALKFADSRADVSRALCGKGWALERLKDFDGAVEAYQKVDKYCDDPMPKMRELVAMALVRRALALAQKGAALGIKATEEHSDKCDAEIEDCFNQAIELCDEVNSRYGEEGAPIGLHERVAHALFAKGAILQEERMGHYQDALEAYSKLELKVKKLYGTNPPSELSKWTDEAMTWRHKLEHEMKRMAKPN